MASTQEGAAAGNAASRWVVFYPQYINSRKTIAEGRRVPKETACENPQCKEIADVCQYLGLEYIVEDEAGYPRDFFTRGRVRVRLFDKSGAPVNPKEAPSRKALFQKVGSLIPNLKSRAEGSSAAAAAGKAAAGKSAAKAGKSRKKGKKGKK